MNIVSHMGVTIDWPSAMEDVLTTRDGRNENSERRRVSSVYVLPGVGEHKENANGT